MWPYRVGRAIVILRSMTTLRDKLVELAIMGAFCWLPKWYKPNGEHTLPEIAEAFMKVFFDGLRPR